jgi:hypothetical protein
MGWRLSQPKTFARQLRMLISEWNDLIRAKSFLQQLPAVVMWSAGSSTQTSYMLLAGDGAPQWNTY